MAKLQIILICATWYAFGLFSAIYWWRRLFPVDDRNWLDRVVIACAGVGGPATWLALWLDWNERITHPRQR